MNKGLKQVSSKPSVFDSQPKKPRQSDFDIQIKEREANENSYKSEMRKLVLDFSSAMDNKTLAENKTVISKSFEKELMEKFITLAQKINSDENEPEGMGSLGLITVLIATCFSIRDKLNLQEYNSVFKFKALNEKIKELLLKNEELEKEIISLKNKDGNADA